MRPQRRADPPVRVLDTRDGTGAPGAVLGPVHAGATVTLELTEAFGVPGHAVGVVANLAVPTATYNGFVSAMAGDPGEDRRGFVSLYFDDRGDPVVNQVTVPLESMTGRVSLFLSDRDRGAAARRRRFRELMAPPDDTTPYDPAYYDEITEGSLRSARAVLPVLFDVVASASVLDVGCGIGAWLSVCGEFGAGALLGVDGDYVDRNRLLVPSDRFGAADLDMRHSAGNGLEEKQLA